MNADHLTEASIGQEFRVHSGHGHTGKALTFIGWINNVPTFTAPNREQVFAPHAEVDSLVDDPVGAVEIADRLNVKRRTVDQWRQRHEDFPAPRWRVGGRPAWNWADVEAWARSSGRGA